jgi:hypothetical protein
MPDLSPLLDLQRAPPHPQSRRSIGRQIIASDADLTVGAGPGAERLLCLNHTGQRARREPVPANVAALVEALGKRGFRVDFDAAKAAIDAVYVAS